MEPAGAAAMLNIAGAAPSFQRHQWGLCHVGSQDKRDAPVNVSCCRPPTWMKRVSAEQSVKMISV